MRIGVLGGTFDPPHEGHLRLARTAKEQLELDEVLLIPARRNPMKHGRHQTPAKHRLKMVELAIADEDGLAVSDLEVGRSGASFTFDTMVELTMARPAEYWFLLGSDALADFRHWKFAEKLARLVRLGCAFRPPDTPERLIDELPDWLAGRVDLVEMPPATISASELRKQISDGREPWKWLKPSVWSYIKEHRLYELGGRDQRDRES